MKSLPNDGDIIIYNKKYMFVFVPVSGTGLLKLSKLK